jgi:hypothetical protein
MILKLVNELPNKPWSWNYLSTNPSIKFTDVLENIDKPWNWKELSRNPSIKFTDVMEILANHGIGNF